MFWQVVYVLTVPWLLWCYWGIYKALFNNPDEPILPTEYKQAIVIFCLVLPGLLLWELYMRDLGMAIVLNLFLFPMLRAYFYFRKAILNSDAMKRYRESKIPPPPPPPEPFKFQHEDIFVPKFMETFTTECLAAGLYIPHRAVSGIERFVKDLYHDNFDYAARVDPHVTAAIDNGVDPQAILTDFRTRVSKALLIILREFPKEQHGIFQVPFYEVMYPGLISTAFDALAPYPYKAEDHNGLFATLYTQVIANRFAVSRKFLGDKKVDEGARMYAADYPGTRLDMVHAYCSNILVTELLSTRVSLPLGDKRLEHCFILAPSGSGKTQLIQSMIMADLEKVKEGEASIVVIDSKGSSSTDPKKRKLVQNLINLQVFATELKGKLTYVKPSADLAFNIFDMDQDNPKLTAAQRTNRIRSARNIILTSIAADSTQQYQVLSRCVELVLLSKTTPTIQTLRRILATDKKDFAKEFAGLLREADEDTQLYFRAGFFGTHSSVKDAVITRIDMLSAEPSFRAMLSKKTNDFYLIDEIEAGKVIVIDADQGILGTHGTEAFGRFFLAQLLYASRQRESNKPVYVYLDEAADFISTDESIVLLLRQARSQDIGITLATQDLIDIKSQAVQKHLQNVAITVDREKGMGKGLFNVHLKDALRPIQIRVEFGVMEDLPRMTNEQFGEVHRPKASALPQLIPQALQPPGNDDDPNLA